MDFGSAGQKTLNDLLVLRMLFLDHFFLFMGLNAMKTPDNKAYADPN